jgi:hypothetical protein
MRSPATRARPWLIVLTAVLAAAVVAPAALAIYPKQSIKLTGPAIGGVKPSGSALVEQCKLPAEPGTLTVTVKSPAGRRRSLTGVSGRPQPAPTG